VGAGAGAPARLPPGARVGARPAPGVKCAGCEALGPEPLRTRHSAAPNPAVPPASRRDAPQPAAPEAPAASPRPGPGPDPDLGSVGQTRISW
jgi:hypothetical protein